MEIRYPDAQPDSSKTNSQSSPQTQAVPPIQSAPPVNQLVARPTSIVAPLPTSPKKTRWKFFYLFCLSLHMLILWGAQFTGWLSGGGGGGSDMGLSEPIIRWTTYLCSISFLVIIVNNFDQSKKSPISTFLVRLPLIVSILFYGAYINSITGTIEAIYLRHILINSEFDVTVTDYLTEGKKIGLKVDVETTKIDDSFQVDYVTSIEVQPKSSISHRLGKGYRPNLISKNKEFIHHNPYLSGDRIFMLVKNVCNAGKCSAVFLPSFVKSKKTWDFHQESDALCSQLTLVPQVSLNNRYSNNRCHFLFYDDHFLVKDSEGKMFSAVRPALLAADYKKEYSEPEKWDEQPSDAYQLVIRLSRDLKAKDGHELGGGRNDSDHTIFIPLETFPKEHLFTAANLAACNTDQLSPKSNTPDDISPPLCPGKKDTLETSLLLETQSSVPTQSTPGAVVAPLATAGVGETTTVAANGKAEQEDFTLSLPAPSGDGIDVKIHVKRVVKLTSAGDSVKLRACSESGCHPEHPITLAPDEAIIAIDLEMFHDKTGGSNATDYAYFKGPQAARFTVNGSPQSAYGLEYAMNSWHEGEPTFYVDPHNREVHTFWTRVPKDTKRAEFMYASWKKVQVGPTPQYFEIREDLSKPALRIPFSFPG